MPESPDQLLQRAVQSHSAGKVTEAESLYKQILTHSPNHAGVLHNLGVLYGQQNRHDDARQFFQRSIKSDPTNYKYQNNLGTLYLKTRQFPDAINSFRRALELNPNAPESHRNLGVALTELHQYEQATASHRRALELNPNYHEAHLGLGVALQNQGKFNEALEAYAHAQKLKYTAQLHLNLATLHREMHDIDRAIDHANTAIELQPDFPEAHFFRATCHLLRGDFASAEADYEYRWRCPGYPPIRTEFRSPRWTGDDPAGKTILLHSEQGFGDEIQFVRFAKTLADRSANVIVECSPALFDLFQSLDPRVHITKRDDPIPAHDFHCPLLSVPLLLNITLDTLPNQVPYLHPNPIRVVAWKSRLSSDKNFKVGLNWAGSPAQSADHLRSIPLQLLAPLAQIPNITLYSLQKGPAATQLKSLSPSFPITDLSADFTETAAIMANLDLVLTVCTSIAHLAGALARPTWTLLSHAADWRWLLDRADSPWYPTMRLFRQSTPRDWPSVIARVADELAKQSAQRYPSP